MDLPTLPTLPSPLADPSGPPPGRGSVAIVGAGVAGLVAAQSLQKQGVRVRVFDKSRGVGGRLATRRTPQGLRFDHGAQYFTARDDRFTGDVGRWVDVGLVQPWDARVVQLRSGTVVADKSDTPRYVAQPGMSTLAKHLATGLETTLETTVSRLARTAAGRWQLIDAQEVSLGEYDRVILTCPPPQTAALLASHTPLAESIAAVGMNPCWALLLQLAEPLELDFDAAFVQDNPLAWVCRQQSKPGWPADGGSSWVLHASAAWSIEHLEADGDQVSNQLGDAFAEALGQPLGRILYSATHRWRYAIAAQPLRAGCLWDAASGLGACGDWCAGSRVEGAFLSGLAMAEAVLTHQRNA
jgi:predicted NAD/FAD-dependent oxidoreductase